jgi:hypothetical protein
MMQRPSIPARMTKLKNGNYKVQCGHECHAPLGEAWPPNTGKGVRVMDIQVGGTPAGQVPGRDWALHAPRNPSVSTAFGFSRRRDPDGMMVYTIIRPKPKRDALGRTVLDARGQPVPRQGGARPTPKDWATGAATGAQIAAGIAGHLNYGNAAPLPAVVECWRCERRTRVPIPE